MVFRMPADIKRIFDGGRFKAIRKCLMFIAESPISVIVLGGAAS